MLVEKFKPRREMQMPWLLRWFNITWALIGNDDDGLFGDDRWVCPMLPGVIGLTPFVLFGRVYLRPVFGMLPQSRNWLLWRAICWWFRNPFHNLFFYVLGVADRNRVFYSSREWGSGGWTFHALNWWWLWLPLVSYRGRINFYAGWRPYGAFGFKLNRSK